MQIGDRVQFHKRSEAYAQGCRAGIVIGLGVEALEFFKRHVGRTKARQLLRRIGAVPRQRYPLVKLTAGTFPLEECVFSKSSLLPLEG